jgi:hypothetical protein
MEVVVRSAARQLVLAREGSRRERRSTHRLMRVAVSAGGIDIALNAVGVVHVQGTPFAELRGRPTHEPIPHGQGRRAARGQAGLGVILTLSHRDQGCRAGTVEEMLAERACSATLLKRLPTPRGRRGRRGLHGLGPCGRDDGCDRQPELWLTRRLMPEHRNRLQSGDACPTTGGSTAVAGRRRRGRAR